MNTVNEKEQIYNLYYQKVKSYIRGKVPNAQDVEDLASDVFLKVYEKLDRFDDSKASLSTWIYTITRNTVIDHYRTQKKFTPLDESYPAEDNVDSALLQEEMLESLATQLEKLDKRAQKIVILRYFHGKTLKEIAQQMELSYSYVKVLHNQALNALRQGMSL